MRWNATITMGEHSALGSPLVAQVTVSTMPPPYGQIFEALVVKKDGQLSRAEVQAVMKVGSHNTAIKTMEGLQRFEVFDYIETGQGEVSYLQFHEDWAWCGSAEFQTILTPNLSKIGGCVRWHLS